MPVSAVRDFPPSDRSPSRLIGGELLALPRVFCAADEDVVRVPDLGHLGLLFSPKVFRAVHERLSAGRG